MKKVSLNQERSSAGPLFRVGFMTDTHIKNTEESCAKVKAAFEFFLSKQPDLIVHLGDLADKHSPDGYRIYRRLFHEIFQEKRPEEIILYADHDAVGCPDRETFYREFQRLLNIPHAPYDNLVIHGYPFLIFPQAVEEDFSRMERIIRQAIKDHPGKPVFVLHHCPMFNTVDHSLAGLCLEGRSVLDKYPQVIHFSGHTHSSLRNGNCIHQDTFTSVNAGCLSFWQQNQAGENLLPKECDEVMIMEVFPEKLILRRFSVSDGFEINANAPWRIPLPFNRETAPYRPENRNFPIPEFPGDAKIVIEKNGSPFHSILFTFPDAEECYLYRAELEKLERGKWKFVAEKEDYGNFYLKEKRKFTHFEFNSGFFEENNRYRLKVTPFHFGCGAGAAIQVDFIAESPLRGPLVFSTDHPEKDCRYLAKKGNVIALPDGWFQISEWNSYGMLQFPEKIWKQIPDGVKLRMTVELEQDQPQFPRKRFFVGRNDFKKAFSTSIFLREGKTPRQRIVFEFQKESEEPYTLLVSHGIEPGPIKFHYAAIEILPEEENLK